MVSSRFTVSYVLEWINFLSGKNERRLGWEKELGCPYFGGFADKRLIIG